MSIYTKNGDSGKTSLLSKRVRKSDYRIELNGQIDELMVMLAFLIEDLKENDEFVNSLKLVYKNLFKITSMIADVNKQMNLELDTQEVNELETEIDEMSLSLPKLKHFIYYTGSYKSMKCQEIRAKVRSVERTAVRLFDVEGIDNNILTYLNRLSDYFYTLGRYLNLLDGYEEDILNL